MTQDTKNLSAKKRLLEPFEIEYSKPQSSLPKPYTETYWRWVALIVMNLLIFGDYMTFEAPQPIETQIKDILDLNEKQYSMLYSVWALPSIFSPFFGGFLIDRLGVRPTLILFSGLVTLGQFIYTYGGYTLGYEIMLIGRAIHALGADSMNVAQIVITNKWFQGKEIGLAMSINAFTCGAGRALNSFLLPILYEATKDLGTPMMFGGILCLAGFVLSVIMAQWDKENEKREVALDSTYLLKNKSAEPVSLGDIKYFKMIVWLLILNFGLINGYSFTFNAFMNDFYHETYEFSNVEAGAIISANFMLAAVSSIFFGKLIDVYGKRALMILYSSLLGIAAFVYFFLFPHCFKCTSTIIPQLLFGLQVGVSMAALLASLPLVLEEKYLGTGFGLFFVFENVFVLLLAPMAGHVKDFSASETSDGYSGLVFFFFVISCFVPFTTAKLLFESNAEDQILDLAIENDVNETKVEDDSSNPF